MKLLLNLPGSNVPEWLGFLLPLIVLVLFIKAGQWFGFRYKQWKTQKTQHEPDVARHGNSL